VHASAYGEITVAEIVQYEARYPAAVITLNNPETRNALSIPMLAGIAAAFERAESDPEVRAIVFTGAGPAFCAGMDLKELRAALDSIKFDRGGAVWASALRGEELIDRVFKSLKPTVAAVNGTATAVVAPDSSAHATWWSRSPKLASAIPK
jgi:enoyl-CoA hydratase/carnithine racemase